MKKLLPIATLGLMMATSSFAGGYWRHHYRHWHHWHHHYHHHSLINIHL